RRPTATARRPRRARLAAIIDAARRAPRAGARITGRMRAHWMAGRTAASLRRVPATRVIRANARGADNKTNKEDSR
ncbi:hypothetical protein, partial [Burkholderia thailandensis]|uniref:hypothetical protein n=1 Tax=Burkholderia thailandensis TaxID=57975 RepID=UPI0021C64D0B